MSRAKGMIRSPLSYRGLGHPLHLSTAPLPQQALVATPVVDQLGLGSCTGNAVAVALAVEMSRARNFPPGQFVELPSRLFLYYHARSLEGTQGQDAGAMISDVFDAASKLGFPPESAWSYPSLSSTDEEQLAKCVAQPDSMAYTKAADQRLVKGVYRLSSSGKQLSDDIARAIAQGSVVVWGTDLDQAFEDLRPGQVWPGVRGQIIGGHAMLLHAFRTNAAGHREFGSLSSWNDSFADWGTAWITEEAAISSVHASEHFLTALQDDYSEAA